DVERGGGDRADADGVDPDAGGQVAGGQLGVVRQRRLGGAVGRVAAPGDAAHHRGDVDDGPGGVAGPPAIQHQRHGRPGQGVGGGDVEVERLLEMARGGAQELPGHGAADVVDDDV